MTDYAPVLWLGGAIRYETLEAMERVLRREADNMGRLIMHDKAVRHELENAANAAAAELTKRPKPACDLI